MLLDESSKKLTYEQLKSMQGRIVSQVQGDFTGQGDQQSWHMTVNLRIAKSAADIKPTDHVIRLRDALQDDPGEITLGDADIGGKQIRIRASLSDKRPYPDARQPSLERVVSHEIGHTLGLWQAAVVETKVIVPEILPGEADEPIDIGTLSPTSRSNR